MTTSTKFWDKIADKYSKQPIADEASYQKKLKVTQEYFKPYWSVLEFGCGTGGTAIIHAPYVKHLRAIDISSEMIKIAKGKAEAKGIDNVTFEQLTIEELEVEDCTYDAVLGLSILHLLENKESAITAVPASLIAKVYKMLKPGGIFVTSTTCMGDAYSWFKLIAPIGRIFGFFPLVKIFTAQHLIESLTDAGFARDYQWQQSKDKAIFIVAKKSG